MKNNILIISVFLTLLAACSQVEITSFEECVEAGNPIMESWPRQCNANGKNFVEVIEEPVRSNEFTECEEKTDVCTKEYMPVCGVVDNGVRCVTEPCASTDVKTFGNSCESCNYALGYYEGSCEDQKFVVCSGESKTGFNATEYAEKTKGICVDICPGNYDPYMTQIGIELCIKHYGKEEINSWNGCEKSSSDCECVKAYETTSNEEIEIPEYKCVPQQYAGRMLFRGGLDRLDENGEQSVAIA